MATRHISVEHLGGKKANDKLKNTSIQFIDKDSKMLQSVNRFLMDSKKEFIAPIKNGNYRPYLIIENEELHTRVVLYMSSSYDEQRMVPDNKIRGVHILKTPYALASYIGSSTIKGTLEEGKISIIDKDRFFFLTDDSFVDMDSRAKDKNDYNVGLMAHAKNILDANDLLRVELGGEHFANIVKSGASELYTYKRGEQKPIIYNPSANYVKLFINALINYENRKAQLDEKKLEQLKQIGCAAVNSFNAYIKFSERVYAIEKSDKLLFQLLQNVRYYDHLITPNSYKMMEENSKKYPNKDYEWRYVYGDAKVYKKIDTGERIKIEAERLGINIKSNKFKKYEEQVVSALSMEQEVTRGLGVSSRQIIGFLNNINDRERIILSDYDYFTAFWNDFYANHNKEGYIEQLSLQIEKNYDVLKERYKSTKEAEKRKQLERQQSEKMLRLQQLTREENIKKSREKLIKLIDQKYFELYGRALSQYVDGKLFVTKSELDNYLSITQEFELKNQKIEIGEKLTGRLLKELKVMATLNPMVEGYVKLIQDGQSLLTSQDNISGSEKLIEIMTAVSKEEQRIAKKNKGKSASDRRPLVSMAIKEMVEAFDENTLLDYIGEMENSWHEGESLLMSMQDIYNSKSVLRSYLTLKENKIKLIDAINELNDQELIREYKLANEVINEIANAGVTLPNSIASNDFDKINMDLCGYKTSALTSKEYEILIDDVYSKIAQIKNYIDVSKQLVTARELFYLELERYESSCGDLDKLTDQKVIGSIKEVIKEAKEELENPENIGYKKVGDKWQLSNAQGDVIGEFEDANFIKSFDDYKIKNQKALVPSVFSRKDLDKEIFHAINRKMFPERDAIIKHTRECIAKSKTIDGAVKKYKEAVEYLKKLEADKYNYIDIIGDEYKEVISSSQVINLHLNGYLIMFDNFKDILIYSTHRNGDLRPGVEPIMKEITNECCDEIKKSIKTEYSTFIDTYRVWMKKIADALPVRFDGVDSKSMLSKSLLKSTTVNGVAMPQALLGQNGLGYHIQKLEKQKNETNGALSRYMLYNDYKLKLIRKTDEGEDLTFEDEQKLKKLELKFGDMQKLVHVLYKRIEELSEKKIVERQRDEARRINLGLLEALRSFALSGDDEREFVLNKNGFEKTLNDFVKKKQLGTKIPINFVLEGQKEVENVTYIDYYKNFKENLQLVRSCVINDTPIEGAEFDSELRDVVAMFYRIGKIKTTEDLDMVKRFLDYEIKNE